MGRNYANFKGENNPNYKNGLASPKSIDRSSLYRSWQGMKQRCLNPKNPKFHRYGGRGIKVCSEWMDIRGFSTWAYSSGFLEGLTLDRINNDGNYKPGNCRWISLRQNSKKKSTTKISDEVCKFIRNKFIEGSSMSELAKEYDVCNGTIWFIVNNITHID